MAGTVDLILRALDVALDRRKLLYTLMFVLLTFVATGVCVLVGGFVAAMSAAPRPAAIIAGLFLFVTWLLASGLSGIMQGGLTAMSVAQLIGAPRVGVLAAAGYAFRRALSFGAAPFVPAVVALLVVLAEIVLLLPGRIPGLAAAWSALLFYPLLLVNLLVALGLLVGGLLLYPALVAGQKSLPAAVREVVGLLRRSPMRVLVVVALGLVALLFAFVLIAVLLGIASVLTTAATEVGSGSLPGGLALPQGPFGRGDLTVNGLGGALFALLSLIFYSVLLTIPITLFNALGAAVYLSLTPAPQPGAPTAAAVPAPPAQVPTAQLNF